MDPETREKARRHIQRARKVAQRWRAKNEDADEVCVLLDAATALIEEEGGAKRTPRFCPRCYGTMEQTTGEDAKHGDWRCDHDLDGKRLYWDYELDLIYRPDEPEEGSWAAPCSAYKDGGSKHCATCGWHKAVHRSPPGDPEPEEEEPDERLVNALFLHEERIEALEKRDEIHSGRINTVEARLRSLEGPMKLDAPEPDSEPEPLCPALAHGEACKLPKGHDGPHDFNDFISVEADELAVGEAGWKDPRNRDDEDLVELAMQLRSRASMGGTQGPAAEACKAEILRRLRSRPSEDEPDWKALAKRYAFHHPDCYYLDPDNPDAGCNCGWIQRVRELGLEEYGLREGTPPLEVEGSRPSEEAGITLDRRLVERIYEEHWRAGDSLPGQTGEKHRRIARQLKAALEEAERTADTEEPSE